MVHLMINVIVATTFFFLVFVVKKDYSDIDFIFGGLLLIQPLSIIFFKYHIISLAKGYLIKISAFDIITYLLYSLSFIYFVGYPIKVYSFDQIILLQELINIDNQFNVGYGFDLTFWNVNKFFLLVINIFTLIQINKIKYFHVKNSKSIRVWSNLFILFNIIVALIVLAVLFSKLFNFDKETIILLANISRFIQALLILNYSLNPILFSKVMKIKSEAYFSDTSLNAERLNILFDETQCYLNNKLNVAEILDLLGLDNSELSASIRLLNSNNFNDFVNEYRINHSVKLINDNYLDNKTIESLAFQSGFNSVQSFHRVFRKFKKKTPSAFKKKNEYPGI
tara:strand:+ start:901 stop:1914 length:1014 start_codon:yes stop_codon:yes gene_type:complete